MPEVKDNLFGQIALKNGFITKQQLQDAMNVLLELTSRGREGDLGELLQEKGFMTASQVANVRRVQNFTLMREADKTYAQHALSKGLITKDQTQKCVEFQNQAYKSGNLVIPSLGELLLEKGFITATQHQSVLEACPTASAILRSLKGPKPPRPRHARPRICAVCGSENPPDATTCSMCGDTLGEQVLTAPSPTDTRDTLRRQCPACKAPLAPDAYRCPRCDQRVCPNCDLPLDPNVIVCGRCGTPFPGREDEAVGKDHPRKAPITTPRTQMGLVVGISALVVLVIAGVVTALIFNKGDSEKKQPTQTTMPTTATQPSDDRAFEKDVSRAIDLARDRADAAQDALLKGNLAGALDMCGLAEGSLKEARQAVPPGRIMSSSLSTEIETITKQVLWVRSDVEKKQQELAMQDELAEAEKRMKEGNLNLAIAHLKKAVEIAPHSYEAHLDYGLALARLGKHRDATKEFDAALIAKPKDPEATRALGMSRFHLREYDAAYENFEEVLRRGDDARSLFHQGVIKRIQGNFEAAVEKLQSVARSTHPEADSFRFDARRLLGDVHRIEGRLDEMTRCYEECLGLDPETFYKPLISQLISMGKGDDLELGTDMILMKDGRKLKGKIVEKTSQRIVLAMQGSIRCTLNYEDIESVEEGVPTEYGKLFNEYVSRLNSTDEFDAEAHLELGIWCVRTNHDRMKAFGAVEFQTVLLTSPENSDAKIQLQALGFVAAGDEWVPKWKADFREAQDLMTQHVYEGALRKLEAAKSANPESIQVRYALVQCLFEMGDYEKARSEATVLLRLACDPNDPSQKEMREELRALLERIESFSRPADTTNAGADMMRCATCKGSGQVVCEACGGKGHELKKCPTCEGTGKLPDGKPCPWRERGICQRHGMTMWMIKENCQACQGLGKVHCHKCDGKGFIPK